MTSEEGIRQVVRESVIETLKILGFPVEKPEELRADMDHLRRWRGYVEASARAFTMAVITIGVGAIGTVVTLGVKAWLAN